MLKISGKGSKIRSKMKIPYVNKEIKIYFAYNISEYCYQCFLKYEKCKVKLNNKEIFHGKEVLYLLF